jgi:hypothetical protein
MTIYHKKINLNINHIDIDLNKLKGDKLVEYSSNLGYFKILDNDYLDSIFIDAFKIPPKEVFLMQANSQVSPHRDYRSVSCMNFYVKPQGYTTNFWIPKENARKIRGLRIDKSDKTKYEIIELRYHRDDLILADTFTAKENEAYLLNIGEIHSVDGAKSAEPRISIQFQWNMTIDELIEKLDL